MCPHVPKAPCANSPSHLPPTTRLSLSPTSHRVLLVLPPEFTSPLPATVSFSLHRTVSSLVSLPFNWSSGNSPSANLKVMYLKPKSDGSACFLNTISSALLHATFMHDASSPSLRPAAPCLVASPSPGAPRHADSLRRERLALWT